MRDVKRDVLLLLVASTILLIFNIGAGSLSSWDEAFYAQVAREVHQGNNWIDLTWGGVSWNEKPPLYMWVTACFYKLFGVNEFSARLLSCMSGIGLVLIVYLFGNRFFSRRIGFCSAIMLLSTYHFIWFSKMGTLDITFTLFLSLAIYSFLKSKKNQINIVYSFLWFSLAFMTKGSGAFLIPLILGLYLLCTREWGMAFNRYTVFGLLVFLILAGSWHIVTFMRHGQDFINGYFLQHIIKRTTSAMDGHYANWMSYINVVLYKGKPWAAVGLLALPFFAFQIVKKREIKNYIFICWVVVVFSVFIIIRTKLHWYIIPVYPAIVIIAAWTVEKFLKRYSIGFVLIISFISIFYFGIKKDIFTLDYNPRLKSFADEVKATRTGDEKVYLYGIGDPGIRFYFGGFSKNIYSDTELLQILNNQRPIIVSKSGGLKHLHIKGKVVADITGDDVVAVRME